ncbi:alpha-L-arabinofuranosidase domain protein [Leadbetterella byssophila DSM 17132]|uniref:non-reducing end alpha-L-arabinofuranosidase n=1 Tax=Leadbetterella byssophila (strain DSM 17132 / JCM 16389 / KACC 11308 / NBRC 106382 / 4M15) TaxID=649349 RepID=E4RYD8_LEAB4|nr:alpha-L-arabinofuranosidase C-terminal domain-containing protein [Leadbetterella byssophila]ADQ18174.1 alpha-L-arabinofuranosidase domain protein [Leadbetterella byssophila DSM 17132]
MKKKILILAALWLGQGAFAQKTFTIDASKKGAEIAPTMWGVFFEDINLGADGGIYAELVKNRSFEFFKPWMGWERKHKTFIEGQMQIKNRPDKPSNPRYLSIQLNNEKKGELGLVNEGFRGMGLKKGLTYDFSILYRVKKGNAQVHVELLNDKKAVVGQISSRSLSGSEWQKLEMNLVSAETVLKGKMAIWFSGEGELDVDMISLFPTDTWKGRKGGMRADMVQMLADMKPGFIRFPGGCIVEGFDLDNRYQWKKTIGPLEERQLIMNRWNIEFAHRPTPDYFQTFGLGFFEYFQLAEDIGAEPLPILNCGMACQFNSGELVALEDLDPYVQDALDLIEFANGDANSTWGRERVKMGHPEPFNLKFIGVGNENWGPQYIERLEIFKKAIKEKYPEIQIVASSGTSTEGDRFELLDKELRKMNIDIIDEHAYKSPSWLYENTSRYDSYDRKGPQIFVGEWASHTKNKGGDINVNNWLAALSESAFMTGLERNADIVRLTSYAPLFAHEDGWQWTPDLIWVDNLNIYGTPSYYVQKQFSTNRGTHLLQFDQKISGQDSLYASTVWDEQTKEIIIKVTNAGSSAVQHEVNILGAKKIGEKAKLSRMFTDDLEAMNSVKEAEKVAPVASEVAVDTKRKKLILSLPARSFSVYRISVK